MPCGNDGTSFIEYLHLHLSRVSCPSRKNILTFPHVNIEMNRLLQTFQEVSERCVENLAITKLIIRKDQHCISEY